MKNILNAWKQRNFCLVPAIKNLTVRHPQNVSWKENGNFTLVIPDPRYEKDPETYKYLGHDSIVIIEEEIEIMLKTELHSMMQKYHIDEKHEDTFMKSFQKYKKRVEEERKGKIFTYINFHYPCLQQKAFRAWVL